MEISTEWKRYILVAIAGIALAAYILPTNGLLDLNAAFAGGNHHEEHHDEGGDTECEGGDSEGGDAECGYGGDGGKGGKKSVNADLNLVPYIDLLTCMVAFLLINLWEEAAWAGFLQTRLERRHNFFLAAALTGIPFAAIHMPLQVITGEVRSAVDFAVGFALLMVLVVFVRALFGMVLRGAVNSLLLVGLTHAMFNRSNNRDGIAADLLPGGDSRQLAALLATIVLAAVLGLVLRRKLSRTYRRRLDEAEQQAS